MGIKTKSKELLSNLSSQAGADKPIRLMGDRPLGPQFCTMGGGGIELGCWIFLVIIYPNPKSPEQELVTFANNWPSLKVSLSQNDSLYFRNL
jgi:hypothetical protein